MPERRYLRRPPERDAGLPLQGRDRFDGREFEVQDAAMADLPGDARGVHEEGAHEEDAALRQVELGDRAGGLHKGGKLGLADLPLQMAAGDDAQWAVPGA